MTLLQQAIQVYLEDHHQNWTTMESERHSKIRITNCGISANKMVVNTTKQVIYIYIGQRHKAVKYLEITLLQQITNIINQIGGQ